MARSSKPKRPYNPDPGFRLLLTRGGGAELIDLDVDETVWTSQDDEEFMEEFPDFLDQADIADILDYLEEVGELTAREADQCEIQEEYYKPSELAGMLRGD